MDAVRQGDGFAMKVRFAPPAIEDFGSIAQHTFSRGHCGPLVPNGSGSVPPKDSPYPPQWHCDKWGEISALGGGGMS
jgi:hypothetical protein